MADPTPPVSHAAVRARFKAEIAGTLLRVLGPEREQDAERLAESIARHRDNLLQAGAGVLPSDLLSIYYGEQLAQAMREHSEQLIETAMHAVQAVAGEALAIGLNRRQ
jgi:hypothetical protein